MGWEVMEGQDLVLGKRGKIIFRECRRLSVFTDLLITVDLWPCLRHQGFDFRDNFLCLLPPDSPLSNTLFFFSLQMVHASVFEQAFGMNISTFCYCVI